jgi:PAS domain S-box-containing protein
LAVKGLASQLQAIHHQLHAITGGEVDAVIGPAGESFLLQQAQAGLLLALSEQRALSMALEREHQRLTEAQTTARIGSWSIDLPSRVFDWSAEMHRIYETDPELEPTLERALERTHPDDRARVRATYVQLAESMGSVSLEYRLLLPRGVVKFVEQRWQIESDLRGIAVRGFGTCQDISDRARAEQEARRLATQLTNTLESLTFGFLSVDREWRITYFNAAAERLLERRREEVLGRLLWEQVPQFLDNGFERSLRTALERNRSVGWEAQIGPAGPWWRAYVDPSEMGLTVHLRDGTLERTALQKLELLESAVAHISDTILITEAVPVEDPGPRIEYVNEAFARMTGYSPAEVLNRSPRLLQGPQTDRAELRRIHAALEQFEPVRTELVNYTKAGVPYWVELEIVPIAEHGAAISHFVSVARDITERKRDQDELKRLNASLEARVRSRTAELELATQVAEQANRAKSTFLSTISHEIRTPMNGVIALVDVLAHTRLPQSQSEMVGLIRESADALLQIIDDMLDFSKLEAGKLQIETTSMHLGRAVEGACALLDPTACNRDVSLTFFVDPRLPATVLGDELRWRQILLNLISNAIKFSAGRPTPGRVAVRVELLETRPDSLTLELQVIDNGIGIDADMIGRLFTPFSRADHSTTRRFGGTGLGLAISSELVRLMGGTIGVESEPEKGSVFAVRLPFALAPDSRARNPSDPRVSGLECRVVGSERPLADDLARYLRHGGARVTQSPDLESAAAAVEQDSGSVWILLPDARAPETALLLRARAPVGEAGGTRFVVLAHGRRRRPRSETPDVVRFDVECLSRSALFKAVAIVADRLPPRAAVDDEQKPDEGRWSDAPFRGRDDVRILVAEDLETNRIVMERQLRTLGLTAEFAADGRTALELWRSGRFALLFTDLRMPELDGYALTAAIRAEETLGRRTAIVALTANALPEDAARCGAAGMDEYLVKPIRLRQLHAVLEKWLGDSGFAPVHAAAGSVPHPAVAPAPQSAGAARSIDLRLLESLIGEDPAGVRAVLVRFRANAQNLVGALREAIRADRLCDAIGPARTLKSGARAIGARRLGELCARIEEAAETEPADTDALATLSAEFQAELAAVLAEVDAR